MLNEPVPALAEPKEILIVEDDPLLRSLVVEIVRDVGAVSRSFSTCDDALAYCEQAAPCLALIVDQVVPGDIHGAEFIAMHHERWPHVPAVLMSGTDVSEEELPPDTVFFLKPWCAEDLVRFIEGAVKKRAYSLHVRPLVPNGPH